MSTTQTEGSLLTKQRDALHRRPLPLPVKPRGTEPLKQLLVNPREAWRLLACSNTHGYALLKAGELESFHDGRSRKITVQSINAYIKRKLAEAKGKRGRGRPRKTPLSAVTEQVEAST
jgi:hypothetical protein